MSEYTYLTGRKNLFEGAPERAMCVLEHVEDDRLFYATANELGATYWNADGSIGLKTGLIALHRKTRMVASRRLTGVDPRKPQPVPSSGKAMRMQAAQVNASAAMNKPKPAAPTVAVRNLSPSALAVEHLKAEQIKPVAQRAVETVRNIPEAAPAQTGGFVSLFDLVAQRTVVPAHLTISRNGNFTVGATIAKAHDLFAFEVDIDAGIIRLGKGKPGARLLGTSRQITSRAAADLIVIPEGENSYRVKLVAEGDWWVGEIEVVKP